MLLKFKNNLTKVLTFIIEIFSVRDIHNPFYNVLMKQHLIFITILLVLIKNTQDIKLYVHQEY